MRRNDNEKHWVEIIDAARLYAAGIAAYCRDNAISKKSYYFWFGRLKAVHPEWQETKSGRVLNPEPQTEVTERARRHIYSRIQTEDFGGDRCVFRTKMGKRSGRKWATIPKQNGRILNAIYV